MTCAKRQVYCTIDTNDGKHFFGTNDCAKPQAVCPREVGEGYEKCKTVCAQNDHAEIEALRKAGPLARGATATVVGHYYICEACGRALKEAGVKSVTVIL